MTNRSLVLLSGEGTSIPNAEARALFLTYDPTSKFESPEPRVLIVESEADPAQVSSRVAFSRRVGTLIDGPRDAREALRGKKVRLRNFDLAKVPDLDAKGFLKGVGLEVDLDDPDYELTLVRGRKDYLALTVPRAMRQSWSTRRPRARAFFHPSAIFPKLSRALVNLSRCREGEVFFDPFSGTGSLLLEAAMVGARPLAADLTSKMTAGSLSNMKHFRQEWLGVVRADAFASPLRRVDAIATDVPYGRVSSTRGRGSHYAAQQSLSSLPRIMRSGSRLVIMHPKDVKVEGNAELALEEEHDLYVHKLLTRTITILRRR